MKAVCSVGVGPPRAVATIRCHGERITARKRKIPAPIAWPGRLWKEKRKFVTGGV